MKVLIITQSSIEGMNYRVARHCRSIIKDVPGTKTLIINASEVSNDMLREWDHHIWIVPEWNHSFPYIFKKIIDDSEYPSILKNKRILLLGTSETTFGNIMGISHLEHILRWIGVRVFDRKICIPNLGEKKKESLILDDRTIETINLFIDEEC